uniref:Uncharacterized protein n=2 Tax=Brassica TaxID=3705 RepID=A0A0D3A742_BRAOL
MAATKMFFRYGFGYAGFSDLKDFWDDLPVSRLKYNALDDFQEVFQTTSMKSSKKSSGLPGSLLTKPPFHNRSERFDDLHGSRPSDNLHGSRPSDNLHRSRRTDDFRVSLRTDDFRAKKMEMPELPRRIYTLGEEPPAVHSISYHTCWTLHAALKKALHDDEYEELKESKLGVFIKFQELEFD